MAEGPSTAEPGGVPGAPAPCSAPTKPRPPRRWRIALITGIIAVVLVAAAATAITLNSSPQGPQYASPQDVCKLVTASILAKYLPGPGYSPESLVQTPNAVSQGNAFLCRWFTVGGNLNVTVNVYGSAAGGSTKAQQAFGSDVRADEKETTANGWRTMTTGKRSVTSLGDQAIALLQTITSLADGNNDASDWVALIVRSGNAETEVDYNVSIPSAAQLPGAIAISRDVLAELPRA